MGKKFIYNDKTAIVETDKGRIRGYFYDGMFIFKGVPYAKARRFHAPEPVDEGNKDAKLAVEMYVYKVQQAIGQFYAIMTRTDAVVMTAGIGENSSELRELIFAGLAHMGMILDKDKNNVVGAIGTNRIVSIDDSPIKICVVTTDEEMRIARETDALVESTF